MGHKSGPEAPVCPMCHGHAGQVRGSLHHHASRRAGWLKGWAALNRAKEAGTEEELADKKSMRIADPSGFSRNAFLAKLVSGQSRTRPC